MAAVDWLVHVTTGNPAPIDAEPNPAGNVVRIEGGRYAIVGGAEADAIELVPRPRYMPHFATCPEANRWRRGSGPA